MEIKNIMPDIRKPLERFGDKVINMFQKMKQNVIVMENAGKGRSEQTFFFNYSVTDIQS